MYVVYYYDEHNNKVDISKEYWRGEVMCKKTCPYDGTMHNTRRGRVRRERSGWKNLEILKIKCWQFRGKIYEIEVLFENIQNPTEQYRGIFDIRRKPAFLPIFLSACGITAPDLQRPLRKSDIRWSALVGTKLKAKLRQCYYHEWFEDFKPWPKLD